MLAYACQLWMHLQTVIPPRQFSVTVKGPFTSTGQLQQRCKMLQSESAAQQDVIHRRRNRGAMGALTPAMLKLHGRKYLSPRNNLPSLHAW